MYLILAAQFESWLHPVTILMSLVLTLIGTPVSCSIFDDWANAHLVSRVRDRFFRRRPSTEKVSEAGSRTGRSLS